MFSDKESWLLVVLENTCLMNDVLAQHGVSFFVSHYGKKYLFDCGQVFAWLDHNLKQMNIDAKKLDAIIISHDHYDHCHALPEVIEKYNPNNIYVPSKFTSCENKSIKKVEDFIKIDEWVYIIWLLNNKVKEQSLIIDFWDKWIMIIVWCSHPWLVDIIQRSQEITWNKKVMWVIWWFHLIESKEKEIQKIINKLKIFDIWFLIPGHCTWIDAVNMLKDQLWNIVQTSKMWSIGVGNYIKFAPKQKIVLDDW